MERAAREADNFYSSCVSVSVWINVILIGIGIWKYKNPLDLNWLLAMHDCFIDFLWNYSFLMMITPTSTTMMMMILNWNLCMSEDKAKGTGGWPIISNDTFGHAIDCARIFAWSFVILLEIDVNYNKNGPFRSDEHFLRAI